ncbi:unnamed protein product, partial [Rotaria sp. Silwood2]
HPLLIRGVLKSTWFIILHTNKIHRYRLKSFGHPANEHKFSKKEDNEITIDDYFNNK